MNIITPPKAPVTFENCATALGTLPVKDKALKVLQYGLRLYLGCANTDSSRARAIETAFSVTLTSRRAFRIGKSITNISNLYEFITSGGAKNWRDIGYITEQTFMGLFYFFDNVILVSSILKLNCQHVHCGKNISWFLSSVAKLSLSAHELQMHIADVTRVTTQMKDEEKSELERFDLRQELQMLQRRHAVIVLHMIRDVCDVILAGEAAGVWERFFRITIPESVIGVLGVTQAAICLYDYWPTVA